jgi:hypothetical protein
MQEIAIFGSNFGANQHASDSKSLNEASARLGHTSTEVTRRVYIRVPYRVKPLK